MSLISPHFPSGPKGLKPGFKTSLNFMYQIIHVKSKLVLKRGFKPFAIGPLGKWGVISDIPFAFPLQSVLSLVDQKV